MGEMGRLGGEIKDLSSISSGRRSRFAVWCSQSESANSSALIVAPISKPALAATMKSLSESIWPVARSMQLRTKVVSTSSATCLSVSFGFASELADEPPSAAPAASAASAASAAPAASAASAAPAAPAASAADAIRGGQAKQWRWAARSGAMEASAACGDETRAAAGEKPTAADAVATSTRNTGETPIVHV